MPVTQTQVHCGNFRKADGTVVRMPARDWHGQGDVEHMHEVSAFYRTLDAGTSPAHETGDDCPCGR